MPKHLGLEGMHLAKHPYAALVAGGKAFNIRGVSGCV